jgi:hypothetical protein
MEEVAWENSSGRMMLLDYAGDLRLSSFSPEVTVLKLKVSGLLEAGGTNQGNFFFYNTLARIYHESTERRSSSGFSRQSASFCSLSLSPSPCLRLEEPDGIGEICCIMNTSGQESNFSRRERVFDLEYHRIPENRALAAR